MGELSPLLCITFELHKMVQFRGLLRERMGRLRGKGDLSLPPPAAAGGLRSGDPHLG